MINQISRKDTDEEQAAILAKAKKLARKNKWLLASALSYMWMNSMWTKDQDEEYIANIDDLRHRLRSCQITTKEKYERYQREVDSMPAPDFLFVEDEEQMKKYT